MNTGQRWRLPHGENWKLQYRAVASEWVTASVKRDRVIVASTSDGTVDLEVLSDVISFKKCDNILSGNMHPKQ